MRDTAPVKVLKAAYKKDSADNQEKLYYFCEVPNTSTVHGGKNGTDKGWIYAGYVNMDLPKPAKEPTKEAKPADKSAPSAKPAEKETEKKTEQQKHIIKP